MQESCKVNQKEKQVQCEITKAHKACEGLIDIVSLLGIRLSSTVLRSEEIDKELPQPPNSMLVPLATEIESIQQTITLQTKQLADIAERLEL